MKEGFTLNQIANAYSAFPCGGEYIPAGFIREIVVDGHTAYKRRERSVRVFSEDTAYLIDDMLKTAAKEGTAKKLRTLPFPIAAKTGTGGNEKRQQRRLHAVLYDGRLRRCLAGICG